MSFFKPKDFEENVTFHFNKLAPIEQFELLSEIANAKLEREGKVKENFNYSWITYRCECGAKLKPVSFEEV